MLYRAWHEGSETNINYTVAGLNRVYSIAFFALGTPLCEQFYEHGKVTDNNDLAWDYCEMNYKYTKNDTFSEYLMKHYIGIPIAGQGWFLLYLFFYSQVKSICLWAFANDSSRYLT